MAEADEDVAEDEALEPTRPIVELEAVAEDADEDEAELEPVAQVVDEDRLDGG